GEVRSHGREVDLCGAALAVDIEEEEAGVLVVDDAVALIGCAGADMESRCEECADAGDGGEVASVEDDLVDVCGEVSDLVDVDLVVEVAVEKEPIAAGPADECIRAKTTMELV